MQAHRQKLIRLTTVDISLYNLLVGQLKFLNQYYEVVGVSADTGVLHDLAKREGIRIINVPMEREIHPFADIKSLWCLIKLFKKERPYILHANTPKGSLLAMIAGKVVGVPYRIYTVTGLRYQGANGILRFILKTMERLTCLFATKVIPEGNGVLHMLQVDGITKKPLAVLGNGNINGIDTNYFSKCSTEVDLIHDSRFSKSTGITAQSVPNRASIRATLGFNLDDFVFVFVGRLVKDKGIIELLHALHRLHVNGYQHAKLLVVGSFESGDAVGEVAENEIKNNPYIVWVGWQDDVRPYLLAADALVFPSYREGFPNVPLQAGALELASIVTNINGCNEIVKDGLNGKIIVAPLSDEGKQLAKSGGTVMEDALYHAMEWFITHPTDVMRMAHNAREQIVMRYRQEFVWQAILQCYQSL